MGTYEEEFGVDERRLFFRRIDQLNTELENARRLEKVFLEKNKKLSTQISTMAQRMTGLEKALSLLPEDVGEQLLLEFITPLQNDMALLARQTSWRSNSSSSNSPPRTPPAPSLSGSAGSASTQAKSNRWPKPEAPSKAGRDGLQSWFASSQPLSNAVVERNSTEDSEQNPMLYHIASEVFDDMVNYYIGDGPYDTAPTAPMRTSNPDAPDVWTGLDATKWANRDHCEVCQRAFKRLHLWHHCRKCARCVCSKCSPFRVALKPMNVPTGVSVNPPVGELLPDGSPRAHRICRLCA